jgi:AcrR family transcriptional regulator
MSETWREQAMSRVLSPARMRAENRVQSFFEAALELMQTSGTDFTVQELVERSGQSLRSFYQYFDGKYALLLAVFEDSVRATTEQLRDLVDEEPDPLERLHRFIVEYYRLCRPVAKSAPRSRQPRKGSPRALADFSQQLLTEHPKEASQAFTPLIGLLVELLEGAAAAGHLRAGLRHDRIAGVMLQAVMFNAFAATISGTGRKNEKVDAAEELWDILLNGVVAG